MLTLQLTDAGLDAIVAAEAGGTDQVNIAEVGLTSTAFDQAPTLTSLPGEFKRLTMLAGEPVAANVIHMTAYDNSADVYSITGIGIYDDAGTLLATYTGAAPVLSKAALAFGLIAFDIAFTADYAASIAFAANTFTYPPATETVKGVARLATQARVDDPADGADDAETIVTPKTLRQRLADFWTATTALVNGEAAARAAADTVLQDAIDAETATRGAADTALQGNINAETAARAGADTALQGAIDAEAAARGAGDAAVQAALDAFKALFSTGSNANGRWWKSPDGDGGTVIEQQGTNATVMGEGPIQITFPIPFTDLDSIALNTTIIENGSDSDMWIAMEKDTLTINGVTLRYQSTGSDTGFGFHWRAKGY